MSESSSCPHTLNCSLYERFRMKSALRIWQMRYCDSSTEYEQCERFRRSVAGKDIPTTLLPNGKHLAT